MSPPFITDAQFAALIENGRRTQSGEQIDPPPVVKLFTPDAAATWLLSEIDPIDRDTAFALCDLGLGCPELGYVSISELRYTQGPLGLFIEADVHFRATKPLSFYAEEARRAGRIVA